jgi:hypothetical protein
LFAAPHVAVARSDSARAAVLLCCPSSDFH